MSIGQHFEENMAAAERLVAWPLTVVFVILVCVPVTLASLLSWGFERVKRLAWLA